MRRLLEALPELLEGCIIALMIHFCRVINIFEILYDILILPLQSDPLYTRSLEAFTVAVRFIIFTILRRA